MAESPSLKILGLEDVFLQNESICNQSFIITTHELYHHKYFLVALDFRTTCNKIIKLLP
jgi:hypothetical protein